MKFAKPLKLYEIARTLNKHLINIDCGSSTIVRKCPEFGEFQVLRPIRMSDEQMTSILNAITIDSDANGCLIGYNYLRDSSRDDNIGGAFAKELVKRLHTHGCLLLELFTFVDEFGSTVAGMEACQRSHQKLWDYWEMLDSNPHKTCRYLKYLRKSYVDGFSAQEFLEDVVRNVQMGMLYKIKFDKKMMTDLVSIAKNELGFKEEADISFMAHRMFWSWESCFGDAGREVRC